MQSARDEVFLMTGALPERSYPKEVDGRAGRLWIETLVGGNGWLFFERKRTLVLTKAGSVQLTKGRAKTYMTTAPLLFESTTHRAFREDPVNQPWISFVQAISGRDFELLARRYYLAQSHLRSHRTRPKLLISEPVLASSREEAHRQLLDRIEERKTNEENEIFVQIGVKSENRKIPPALLDFSIIPPTERELLGGPGRPPTDALCLIRAFLAAPLLNIDDSPADIHLLLHSNPNFARECGFLGRDVKKAKGEWTSYQLPSVSNCADFDEIMTRYGLWHLAASCQVQKNFKTGVLQPEVNLAADTTHIEANSHCANVVPLDVGAEDGKKPKQRKVPRVRKDCDCGKEQWESCTHPWRPTDEGAAVVVKSPTRIYWAHKVSVASLGDSEIPISARVLGYAATHDSKTLVPHLEEIQHTLPELMATLKNVLADSAYHECFEDLKSAFPSVQLHTPVRQKAPPSKLQERYKGIDHFTRSGLPICQEGHSFELRGRDILEGRFIMAAPDGDNGQSVCVNCPKRSICLKDGQRRHIRVPREELPNISWENPQHFARNKAIYAQRTGVERAIKRMKVDLRAENLSHRHGARVQAHLDRRLLAIHLLLAIPNRDKTPPG